jgi:hypothetical protein
MGGVIAPGPRAGIEGLAHSASKLPFIDLVPPDIIIGRRTDDCLRSGCFFAIVDAIDGMARRIKKEWERPGALVLATGGLAALIAPHCGALSDSLRPRYRRSHPRRRGYWLTGRRPPGQATRRTFSRIFSSARSAVSGLISFTMK